MHPANLDPRNPCRDDDQGVSNYPKIILDTMSHRPQRVADQIQRELAQLLTAKVQDPRFHALSITEVNVSPDLKNATVYVSLIDSSQLKATLTALNKASGFFRSELAHELNLRVTPKLKFAYDDSLDRGQHLTDLLNNIKKEEEPPRG